MLGRVIVGYGNNGTDGWEGAVAGRVYGTYLHGPLLPKNPAFADRLIREALSRRFPAAALAPLPDTFETRAREAMLTRLGAGRMTARRT
jgi:CobQ-like glutamine amidotransferase family enzyme